MRTALRRLVAAAQAFALSACMLVGGDALVAPGGAEDFPNTVTALGRIAVSDVASSSEWEQVQDIELPEMPTLDGLDSLQVAPPTPKFAVLGKTAVDTLDFSLWQLDYNRLFEAYFFGKVYAYAVDSTATSVRRDTVVALFLGEPVYSASLFDSVQANPGKYLLPIDYRGAVQFTATGVRQTYRLRNVNSEGDMDIAEYATFTPLEGGGSHRKWVKIYGPEGAFRLPNPVPEEYELVRRGPMGDTLEWTFVKDADYDRKLWASNSRGIVDLFLRVREPQSQPEILRMHSYLRAELSSSPAGDSLKQLIYQEQRWLRSGRNTTFTFQGLGTTGAQLFANDTARMTIDTVYALRDSMIRYSASYKMLLGPSPDQMDQHKLVSFGIAKNWRIGTLFSNTAIFVPTLPMPMGQSGFEGYMSTTAVYTNQDTIQTQGFVTPTGFNLTVRSVKEGIETIVDVILDAAGNLIP